MFLVDRMYLVHPSDNPYFLIGLFSLFAFNVIIPMVGIILSNLLVFVFSLSYLFLLLFWLNIYKQFYFNCSVDFFAVLFACFAFLGWLQ